jgi:uncharacterized protein with von Willebrand factor type A (vWA) domain
MLVTDAGIAVTPSAPRGPLRLLFSWLGLSTLTDDRSEAPLEPAGVMAGPEHDRRQAQAAVRQAMLAARHGAYEPAEAFFTAAFSLDRSLEPARIDTFWQLDLAGIETAERALRNAGRQHDALALANQIAYRFGGHPTRRPVRAAS